MKRANYLIGVDSDGTAFDSMNLKHLNAFIPAALEIWPMPPEAAERFSAIEQEINLFSAQRGVNRFPGLLEAFERLERECPDLPGLPDLTDFRAYIAGESKYSARTLKDWMAVHPSRELMKVLAWSERADVLFAASCEGLLPFPGVKEALQKAHEHCAVAVVSSAARASLEKDWDYGGLLGSVDLLMSQEDGSKTAQLIKAREQCEPDVQVLMLGDTDSDGEAAHEAGARFYPIMPGDETASWQHFAEVILPLFLAGKYGDEEEKQYARRMKELLHCGD